MKPKTEELLYTLLWTCDIFFRPTFRNLTDSFESWTYRNGLLRQLQRLEKRGLVEAQTDDSGGRLHRLTEAGLARAMGGRDPEASWRRHWDGRWRLVVYDVPEAKTRLRNKLRCYLRNRGFGYLQHSVWISPHPVDAERAFLAGGPVDAGSLIVLEARPSAGETDTEIVAAAWDFAELNDRYARHREILSRYPHGAIQSEATAKAFLRWMREEREAWNDAYSRDPLLPKSLLPDRYSGRQAWADRQAIMKKAGQQMRAFEPA